MDYLADTDGYRHDPRIECVKIELTNYLDFNFEVNMNEFQQIFLSLLSQQTFIESDLDYSLFDKHRPSLERISFLCKSSISVFDLFKREHIFYSPNLYAFLGYNDKILAEGGAHFIDSRIHPEDYILLMKNGIAQLKLIYQFSSDEKVNYKQINEFRILSSENRYVRVIEQHQVLELDSRGNLWLDLSIMDLSPNQNIHEESRSQLLNFRTGKVVPFHTEETKPIIELTRREQEILQLVKNGLLSKEISDMLSISIHTVNTHRQKILEKTGANNSMEAIIFSSKLGLLE